MKPAQPAWVSRPGGALGGDRRSAWDWRLAALVLLVLAITLAHYGTQTTRPLLHDVYRRLYYLPVGLSAIWFGLRGGLTVAVLVAVAYAPHILLDWHHQHRELANQFMEIGFYFAFAGLLGYFADRERRFRERWQESAQKLERSYSELRRQADLILEIEDQLRRADRLSAIGQLAAGMAHEIRNPLGAIKGTAEILRDDFPPEHPKAEFLGILLKESDRLNQVVEDFLTYARPSGSDEGTEIVDLGAVTRETIALLETPARKAGVTIRAGDVKSVIVRGPSPQLKQVALNLILNAVQATPPGKAVTVETRLRPGKVPAPGYRELEGNWAELLVEDEGAGIPDEILRKVFDPFFTTKGEGTGLGLAISQRIARAHGGEIVAENREGGGARFSLTLPSAD